MAKTKRRLKNLKIDEISFVDRPANLRPFLFWKSMSPVAPDKVEKADVNLDVAFTTDGTPDGTEVKVNGAVVDDLNSFSLSYWPAGPVMAGSNIGTEKSISLSCNYMQSTGEPDERGFRSTRSFGLSKNMVEDDPVEKAQWTSEMMNDLPDSSFLYVEPGGKKDEDSKTEPRSLRHFPVKGMDGKVDMPHLRNALARIPQSDLPDAVKAECTKRAEAMMESMKESKMTKADAADLDSLRAVAEVADGVDGDLAKALAPHAAVVALYKADLPQELATAIGSILTLACETQEVPTSSEIQVAKEDVKAEEAKAAADKAAADKAAADKAKTANVPATQLGAEEIAKIAEAVVAKLASDKAAADAKAARGEEEDLDPAKLGAELATAVGEAINGTKS